MVIKPSNRIMYGIRPSSYYRTLKYGNFVTYNTNYPEDMFCNESMSPDDFWDKILHFPEPLFVNLAKFVLEVLSLPHANADCERIFSAVNLIKTNTQNQLITSTINGTLLAKQFIRRTNKSCFNFKPTREMISKMKNPSSYSKSDEGNEDFSNIVDLLGQEEQICRSRMEWLTPNEILRDEITKLNHTMIPPDFKGDARSMRAMQTQLSAIINKLGEQSATSQGLSKVITTAEKMQKSPTYTLYLLKDANINSGKGEVVGMLKVGRKHLFLYDQQLRICEVDPLCVLDFYVKQDCQRRGYGRRLFDYMLQDTKTSAHLVAVDGPSPKMEQFLAKNYGIENLVRQNNNFAVSPYFFKNLNEIRLTAVYVPRPILEDKEGHSLKKSDASESSPVSAASTSRVGRFTAHRRDSTMGHVIHGSALDVAGAFTNPAEEVQEPVIEPVPVAAVAAPVTQVTVPAAAPAARVLEPVPEASASAARMPARAEPQRPRTLQVNTASVARGPTPTTSYSSIRAAGIMNSRRPLSLTCARFDMKYYHSKLW